MTYMRKMTKAIATLIALVGLAYVYYWYSTPSHLPSLQGQLFRGELDIDQRSRTYLAYVPAKLQERAGLIIVLHGSFMNGAWMREVTAYEFDELAEKKGFAVVYPDGYKGNWNDCRKKANFPAKIENIDDMAFLRGLIERMSREHHIDSNRVFAFGYSNGGHMAFRLALTSPHLIEAFASTGASLPHPEDSSCPNQGATRAMLVNGTADPLNPFGGGTVSLFGLGKRGEVLSSLETAKRFAAGNGADLQSPKATILPHQGDEKTNRVVSLSWVKANGQPIVTHYEIEGGGHVVPQSRYRFPRLLGTTSTDLDVPAEAVSFFGL